MSDMESFTKGSYTYEDLLACSRGDLFNPDSARLPAPPMLMFDRITHANSNGGEWGCGQIIAELDIKPDLWFFQCHFLNDPVMPGCLGLDALWQLLGFFLSRTGMPGRGRALGVGNVKFHEQVLPASKLVKYYVDVRRIISRGMTLGIGKGKMYIDGILAYEADDLRVTLVAE